MIPEDQLARWSNQGGTTNSIAAHKSIRAALEATDSIIYGRNFEIFLQGSYKNSTNIRADSDVDVVVQSNEVFYKNLSRLPIDQQAAQLRSYGPGRHDAKDWRADVENALRKKFGKALQASSGKAFHVITGPDHMTADILAAVQFKNYTFFQSLNNEHYDEGVEFVDAAGKYTVNYPKLHIKNGETKNSTSLTNGYYKPAVRLFKNARNCATDRGLLVDGTAPSYFVECLLFNAPDGCFKANASDTYVAVVNHLLANPIDTFTCQNGQLPLFGSDSTQWSVVSANLFVHALVTLWEKWE